MRAEDRGSFRGSTSLAEALAEAPFSIRRSRANTLNLKMKIPLYLQSPDKFWAGRWRRRNNLTHFVTGVVKGASTVILSRDRVPGTNVVTGISRKLRGRSAEAMGCVWEQLLGHTFCTTVPIPRCFGLSPL